MEQTLSIIKPDAVEANHIGEIKNVDLYHSFVAVSKWGGPIAVTKDMQ